MRIVGIVNATPDSFSDGGEHASISAAVAHGLKLVDEGADALDVGGESTRPGATAVDAAVERSRVIPVIERLVRETRVPISIDSSKPEVMRAAVAAGAGWINDVRALTLPGALEAAAALKVPVTLMHMKGTPADMQVAPHYGSVVDEVRRFLAERIFAAELAGIDKKRLIVDPGFGFGKTHQHNYALLAALYRLRDLDVPILVGVSRKRMIGDVTGIEQPRERVLGSVVAAVLAAERGAKLLRVHDVAATRQGLSVLDALRDHAPPEPGAADPMAKIRAALAAED